MIARFGHNRYLLLLVFTVGMATLGAEIAAARLMAPFFGASTLVWANTIAVVLVALSIGYALGGRLGDRHPSVGALARVITATTLVLGAIPFVARPFFDVSVKALDQIQAGAFVGSLVGVLAMIAVPVLALAVASPWAIRLAIDDVDHSGRTAGRLYAVSTAGSLVGTMLAALVLIPFAGTQRTFVTLALVVAVVAAPAAGRRWLIVPVALAIVLALPVGQVKPSDRGRTLYETETAQQYARVIQDPDGDRVLELNEGQAIHSLLPAPQSCGQPRCYLTGRYWDWPLVLPAATRGAPPRRMAILGNAGGTIARSYGHYFPETHVDAVDIDPKLNEIARRWFDLHGPNLNLVAEDARPFLRRSAGGYDAVFVDAYRQPYIPFYLTTVEFFELARERLSPGGMVIVNVAHPDGARQLPQTLGATMQRAFPYVRRVEVESSTTLLIGSTERPVGRRIRSAIYGRVPDLSGLAVKASRSLRPPLPGGDVYTDDRAPVEWLIDRSILGYAGGG